VSSALRKPPWLVAYSFPLVTGGLFLMAWYGQFVFQARAYVAAREAAGEPSRFGDYLVAFFAATFENWQAEFLALVWQVAALAVFYHWGSSQSRERSARVEAKIDVLLRRQGIDPDTLR
jgi:hypothetical protein